MKAPSVRGGSKENGTQVTGNRIYKGCLVSQSPLPDLAPIQPTIANIPGSGLGDGNLLYGVGVVYLYPYSIESLPLPRLSVPPSRSTFKPGSDNETNSSKIPVV
jgi:hypothetical protein